MRLAAAACALAIVVVVAVFGAVLAQKAMIPAPAPAVAATPPSAQKVASAVVSEIAPTAVAEPVAVTAPPAAAPIPAAGNQTIAQAPAAAIPAPTPVAAPAVAAPAVAPPLAAPAPPPARAPAAPASCPGNPDALGIARTLEIDTTGGPGFGFEHFKTHDFLREGEVVLTFDDGPWQNNTPAVLAALAAQCTKAIFFPIGLHATYYPEILKQVAAAGHTIGSHTWSHQDLTAKKGKFKENGKSVVKEFEPKDEIEKGISAVHWAVGGPTAPFFRFPALRHPPELVEYLGKRNVAMFSTDMDSFDFKMRKPEQVIKSVLDKLKKHGKGIVLMHDFQHATAQAMPELLRQLKANNYKIVFLKAKNPVQTIASYDELILKEQKLPTVSDRPTSSIVREISN